MNAPFLTPLAVTNMDVLDALGSNADFDSIADLARHIGRDRSNLAKTLKTLTDEGLITDAPNTVAGLTPAGQAALDAWARAATLPGGDPSPEASAKGDTIEIPFDQLEPWPDQPRSHFDDAFIDELSVSIADKGILQPLIVRPVGPDRYQVVIGENRRRAACIAVAKKWCEASFTIPCRVRDLTDDEAFEIAVTENVQRDDLHWMDEARSLLRLAERGRTAAQIERIFGGARGKRSIQDYTKIARELPTDVAAQAYLPPKLANGQPNPAYLSYVKARELVGDKREKPALDITPKLALALLEILYAADLRQQGGGPRVAVFASAPVGGPIGTLAERKLITWRFHEGRPAAQVMLTDDVVRWLDQIGWTASPTNAVTAARVAVMGDLQTAALPPGQYFTRELQPHAPPVPPLSGEVDRPQAETEGASAAPPDDVDEDDDLDDILNDGGWSDTLTGDGTGEALPPFVEDPLEPWERRLIGAPEPATAPAPAPAKPDLPPILALLMIEIVDAIYEHGVQRPGGEWCVAAMPGWHRDTGLNQLIQSHRMVKMVAHGDKTTIALADPGKAWLAEACDIRETLPNGKLRVLSVVFVTLQTRFAGQGITYPGPRYHTTWLNPVEVSPPSSSPSPEDEEGETEGLSAEASAKAEASSAATADPHAETAVSVPRTPTGPELALTRAVSLLDQLQSFLIRAGGNLTQANRAEADQLKRMIDNVRDDARQHLPEAR